MNPLSMIRLGTYLILVVIVLFAQNQIRVIPVALSDPDLRDAAVEAEERLKLRVREIERLVESPGFLGAKRSGAELFSISNKAAETYGVKLSEFHRPYVKVTLTNGTLQWVLVFVRDYGPGVAVHPAKTIAVTIDDESGAASVKDESARM